jgi:GGDEF domain-containing protein
MVQQAALGQRSTRLTFLIGHGRRNARIPDDSADFTDKHLRTASADRNKMISIKRFLDQRRNPSAAERDMLAALTQMGRMLLDGMARTVVHGRETDWNTLHQTFGEIAQRMEAPQSTLGLLSISSDAVEALETYCQETSEYFREGKEQMRSMVAMLTATVGDLSGQTDASVARLQAIEKAIEQASELSDIQDLRSNLESCLLALRETAAQQRARSAVTEQRLREHIEVAEKRTAEEYKHGSFGPGGIDLAPEPPDGPLEEVPTSYVAAFKLQRAEHIAKRFGEPVRRQMLATIGTELKKVLGPDDKLLRWKGTSIVVFISSTATAGEIKARLYGAVAATGQQYVELGRKSALLAVGVDWILFPQSDHPSLEAALGEVDAFLAGAKAEASPPAAAQR